MKQTITTTPAAPKTSALGIMAAKMNVDPSKLLDTLRATAFKGASNEEMLALVVVANEFNLNPLTKQIYAFPAKGGGIVPVVSIDGWVSMVNDHPAMDGMEFEEHYSEAGKLEAITCKLWRKDRSRPIMVTEHLSECRRNTDPWKMEHRMLRHKALMQCARYAFGFSGITDEDEAAETPGLRDVTPAKTKGANVGEVIDPFKPAPAAKVQAYADNNGAEPEAAPVDLASMPDQPWGDEPETTQGEGDLL